jgi:hypothetical protein
MQFMDTTRKQVRNIRTEPEYGSWLSMVSRCTKPARKDFKRYGGAGITVCARWMDFRLFLADMGPKPSRLHSLDRMNGATEYGPGNVRWATPAEQARNRKSTRFFTYEGETLCITDLASRLGVSKVSVQYRIKTGWTVEQIAMSAKHGRRYQRRAFYLASNEGMQR